MRNIKDLHPTFFSIKFPPSIDIHAIVVRKGDFQEVDEEKQYVTVFPSWLSRRLAHDPIHTRLVFLILRGECDRNGLGPVVDVLPLTGTDRALLRLVEGLEIPDGVCSDHVGSSLTTR